MFHWSFACSQVLLWAYGVTVCAPSGIKASTKINFQNYSEVPVAVVEVCTCERFAGRKPWWR